MIFGLDLFTLGVAFFLFAFILGVLWKIIWHTFHGDIGEVFIFVIIGAVVVGLILMGMDWFVF